MQLPGLALETAADGSFAVFSKDRRYRYLLRRPLGGLGAAAVFVMLNPSTADAFKNDPTVRRCQGFASSWGASELVVLNLFAYRATDPREMAAAADPAGPVNNAIIACEVESRAPAIPVVVCAWGAHRLARERGATVWRILADALEPHGVTPKALRVTKGGDPGHPLYLPKSCRPVPFRSPHA